MAMTGPQWGLLSVKEQFGEDPLYVSMCFETDQWPGLGGEGGGRFRQIIAIISWLRAELIKRHDELAHTTCHLLE